MQHQHHMTGAHSGVLGPWPMTQEGSGTSWLPVSSPMWMKSLGQASGWDVSLMGFFMGNYADAGGRRGDNQLFSNSMIMLHGSKNGSGGTRLGWRVMASFDPFNGRRGYPDLFQTGETAGGVPLVDRQHPHDLLSELSFVYSAPVGSNLRAFGYLAAVGEPALGNSPFAHRPSGMEIPESPISHHWFDGTHITYGVATLGMTSGDKWKVDVSTFKGREPDEDRFNIDPMRLDSYSGRVTYNPTRDLSAQISYAYVREPESLEPGVDQHKLTASLTSNRRIRDADWDTTLLWGRNMKRGTQDSEALVLESSYLTSEGSLFGRWENVDKDELANVPSGSYKINKFTVGGVKNFWQSGGFEAGLGAFVSFNLFPHDLEPYYGKNPMSIGVFVRIRPGRMRH